MDLTPSHREDSRKPSSWMEWLFGAQEAAELLSGEDDDDDSDDDGPNFCLFYKMHKALRSSRRGKKGRHAFLAASFIGSERPDGRSEGDGADGLVNSLSS